MVIHSNQNLNITLNGEKLETVNKFTYLGSVITDKGGTEEDVSVRIGKANQAFRALQTVWNSKTHINLNKTKIIQEPRWSSG